MTMTPWFELVRRTRERHDRMLARGAEARLAGRVWTREPLRRAYFRAWWWCRPRDWRRIGVMPAGDAPGRAS